MRIRYLTRFGYGLNGISRSVITQAGAMAAAGHEVEVVSLRRKRDEPAFPADPRVRMFALIDDRGRERPDPLDEEPAPLIGPDQGAAAAYSALDEQEVARYVSDLRGGVLITTQQPLSAFAARYGSAKVLRVAQEHMHYAFYSANTRRVMEEYFPQLDGVGVLTSGDLAAYLEGMPGAGTTLPVRLIPNPLHQTEFEPAPLDRTVVSAVGRLHEQKGFDLLIEAFEQVLAVHPGWQLRIYGTGPLKGRLRKQIEERHLYNNVLLMGRSADIDAEYPKSSIFVLSSRYEGFGLALLEAMAHGLPVVSFDCPHGPADIITHERDGLLVPPGDVGALAKAITLLIDRPLLRAALGVGGRVTAARYRPELIAEEWAAYLTELLEARGIPPG